jgi:hypothetical protein
MLTFDFSNDTSTLVELVQEIDRYNDQKDHVTESLNRFMAELYVAERNEDEKAMEDLQIQIRSMSIPFMLPTIMPLDFGGTVNIGFTDDPKFVFYTSDQLNQPPYKVTMIFDSSALFCEDEVAIYTADTEDEIREQQEELWYMDEARKLEEENYQAQFGYYGGDGYGYEDDEPTDKRLKGVRIK